MEEGRGREREREREREKEPVNLKLFEPAKCSLCINLGGNYM